MTPQTVSLEIAKQLKEAGWKKRCFFAYSKQQYVYAQNEDYQETSYDPSNLQAPQMHEILEELPSAVYTETNVNELFFTRNRTDDGQYRCGYEWLGYSMFYSKNPHDACALLWLWCVKEGYIHPNNI